MWERDVAEDTHGDNRIAVPEDHFLRRLEATLVLSFVYEETRKLYSHRYGRPPIGTVVPGKISASGLSVWHPAGTADRAAGTDRCGAAVVPMAGSFCTVPSPSFGGVSSCF